MIVTDRSPLSAAMYGRDEGSMTPLVRSVSEELRRAGMKLFTVYVRCDAGSLKRRLVELGEYDEASARVESERYAAHREWDFVVDNGDSNDARVAAQQILEWVRGLTPPETQP